MYTFHFCPVCGKILQKRPRDPRDLDWCADCGYVHYKNPLPAAVAIVEREGELLLILRGMPPEKDKWTFPSGFMEAGESPEEACLRELKEETGLTGEIVDLLGVYHEPSEMYGDVLNIFFVVRPEPGSVPVAGDDAADVRYVPVEEIGDIAFASFRQAFAEYKRRYPADNAVSVMEKTRERIRRAARMVRQKEPAALMKINFNPKENQAMEFQFDETLTDVLNQMPKGAFLTVKSGDKLNTMTIGWASPGIIWRRPMLSVYVRASRYTNELLQGAKDFTLSIPLNGQLRKELGITGKISGRVADKIDLAELELLPSEKIESPGIADCDVVIECRLVARHALSKEDFLDEEIYSDVYPTDDLHTVFYGEIVNYRIFEDDEPAASATGLSSLFKF